MKREERQAAAERDLTEYRRIASSRDSRVLEAHNTGISKNRIHTLTGIARTTVDRIVEDSMTITLVSAQTGDSAPGYELADPDCPDIPGLLERVDVQEFMDANGYGPDDPDELMYVVTDDSNISDGYPTLTIRLPKVP